MANVLIIDDNDQIRELCKLELTDVGHKVLEAGNGLEGIRVFQQNDVDIVICDLAMPEKEGLETIRDLRRLRPDLKILAVSGWAYYQAIDFLSMAEAMGARRTLRKPFTGKVLIQAVDEVLHEPAKKTSDPT
jgi:CheY-like chemotaxis protein